MSEFLRCLQNCKPFLSYTLCCWFVRLWLQVHTTNAGLKTELRSVRPWFRQQAREFSCVHLLLRVWPYTPSFHPGLWCPFRVSFLLCAFLLSDSFSVPLPPCAAVPPPSMASTGTGTCLLAQSTLQHDCNEHRNQHYNLQ